MTRRFPIVAALGLLAAMLGLAPPAPPATPAPSPGAAASADPSIIVMTFNIRYGTANDGENAWPKRKQLVIDRIRESRADIVGLQEALRFQIDELLAAMPECKAVGVGRDDGKSKGEHAAILYRHPRLELEPDGPQVEGQTASPHGDFWYSDTPETPGSKSWGNNITRICTWARLRDAVTAGTFFVFNTHLDHESQPSREKSVELLKQRVAERKHQEPVIITGDFNAGEANPAVLTVLRSAHSAGAGSPACPPLRDSYRVLHADEREVGTFNSFKNNPPFKGDKIDYIFIDDRWEVLEAAIDRTMPDGRCPSDHFPVTAKLRLKPAAPAEAAPKP